MNFPMSGGMGGGGGGGESPDMAAARNVRRNYTLLQNFCRKPGLKSHHLTMQQMSMIMESCPAKTVMAGTMGFAMGGLFGLFMASVSNPSSPHYQLAPPRLLPSPNPPTFHPDVLRQQSHTARRRNIRTPLAAAAQSRL